MEEEAVQTTSMSAAENIDRDAVRTSGDGNFEASSIHTCTTMGEIVHVRPEKNTTQKSAGISRNERTNRR